MIVSSIRALAQVLGLSHTMLNRHFKAGKFQEEPGGGFNVEKVRDALKRNTDASHPSKISTPEPPAPRQVAPIPPEPSEPRIGGQLSDHEKYNKARAHREFWNAKKAELEHKVRSGEVVEVAKVNAWVAGMIILAATVLDRIPDEMADRLAQESDPVVIKDLLRKEVTRARNELAEYRA